MKSNSNRKKYGLHSKKNPWRNTRRDRFIPWYNIWSAVFLVILPILVVFLSSNFVMRSGAFYSFTFEKTGVISDIPFAIEQEKLVDTYTDYMLHKKSEMQMVEDTDYMPRNVFNEKDQNNISKIRLTLDISLALGILMLAVSIAIFIFMLKGGEKKLLYGRFLKSLVIFGIIELVILITCFIPGSVEMLQKMQFGKDFALTDVVVIVFNGRFLKYFGIWELLVSCAMMGVITYVVHHFASRRKMFRKVEE